MYIMCIVCLGYLCFLPTSPIASVLCTCISMYVRLVNQQKKAGSRIHESSFGYVYIGIGTRAYYGTIYHDRAGHECNLYRAYGSKS